MSKQDDHLQAEREAKALDKKNTYVSDLMAKVDFNNPIPHSSWVTNNSELYESRRAAEENQVKVKPSKKGGWEATVGTPSILQRIGLMSHHPNVKFSPIGSKVFAIYGDDPEDVKNAAIDACLCFYHLYENP